MIPITNLKKTGSNMSGLPVNNTYSFSLILDSNVALSGAVCKKKIDPLLSAYKYW